MMPSLSVLSKLGFEPCFSPVFYGTDASSFFTLTEITFLLCFKTLWASITSY